MLRHIARLLLCGLLVSVLSACLPNSSTQEGSGTRTPIAAEHGANDVDEPVQLSFAVPETDRARYGPLVNAFNQENSDIYVQLVTYNPTSLTRETDGSAIRTIVSMADTAAVAQVSPNDIRRGYLVDMAPLIAANPDFPNDDYVPGVLEAARQDDGLYMLPHTLHIPLFFYNERLWEMNGLQLPDDGWTWDALLAAAEQLTQQRDDTVDVYGLLDTTGGVSTLISMAVEGGMPLLERPIMELRLDQPDLITAARRVVDLIDEGVIYAPTDAAASPDALQRLIRDERIGIWYGEYLVSDTLPDSPSFAIGTSLMPQSPLSPLYSIEGYVISSGTAYPQEAWRWLTFLNNQPVHLTATGAMPASRLPARASFAEQSDYWEQLDTATAAALQAYLDNLAANTAEGMLDTAVLELLGAALQQVINDDQSVEQAFADAQALRDTQLAQAEPTPTSAPISLATPAPLAAAPGATVITFMPGGADAEQVERLAQEFNQQQTDIFVQVQRLDASGGQRPQDVAASVDCFSWFSPPEPLDLPAMLDLRPFIDADPSLTRADYPPALLAPFEFNTGIYGLPFAVDFRVLMYNKRIFDEFGLDDPDSTWTLDELQVAAQQMTSGDEPTRTYGFATTGDQTDDLFFFLSRLGAAPVKQQDGRPQPDFTDSQVVQAIRLYLDLLQNSSPHEELKGYTQEPMASSIYQLIQAGQVGMWLELPIYGAGLNPIANPLVETAIAPPPLNDQPLSPDDFHVRGLYISAESDYADACWVWLKQLAADTSWYPGRFPARLSQAEDGVLLNTAFPGADQVYAAYRDVLTQAPTHTTSGSNSLIVMDYFWFFRAIDQAMTGVDLEQELDEAQEVTERYLSCVEAGGLGGICATQVDPTYEGWQAPRE